MSTVIRDVIIRVGIQNGQSTLSMSGIQAAAEASQRLTDETNAASVAAANMWQNLRGPTAAEAAAQFETAADGLRQMADEADRVTESASKTRQVKDTAEDLAKAQKDVASAYLQAGEASKMAMSGVLSLGRSYAYLTAATEDDLKSAMQLIATVEGVAHSITGTIDVVSGLVKWYRAMEAAGKAAAVANVMLAVSQRGINAGAAGSVAGGAVAGAGSTAGAIGGFAAFKLAATQGAAAIGAFAAKFIALPAVIAAAGIEIIDRLSGGGGFLSVLDEWAKEKESNKNTANAEKRSSNRLTMAQDAETRFGENASMQAQVRQVQTTTQSALSMVGATSPEQQLDALNKQRSSARQELMQAQAEIAQAEQNAAQRRSNGQAPLMAEMAAATERQKTAAEQLQQIEERRVAALRSGQDALRAQRDQQMAAMQTAQQALQIEQDKNRSLAVRFAQLTEIERTQLKAINDRVSKGESIGEADAAFLEQKGFGQKLTEDFRVKQAGESGFGSLAESLGGGGNQRESQLRDEVKKRQKQIDQITGQILESQGQLEQAEASLVEAINGFGNSTIAALTAAQAAMQKQKERIDRMQQANRN